MRLLPLALIIVFALGAPLSTGTPSGYQNDAGTGGDGGNTPNHAAPLTNRTGNGTNSGSEGVYMAEMYRVVDEADWFSTVMAVPGNITVAFTAETTGACANVTPDTTFVAWITDPKLTIVAGPVPISPCYATGTISAPVPADDIGRYRIGFTLEHPADVASGLTGVAAPTSSLVHVRYAFGVTCGGVCFQGGVNAWP